MNNLSGSELLDTTMKHIVEVNKKDLSDFLKSYYLKTKWLDEKEDLKLMAKEKDTPAIGYTIYAGNENKIHVSKKRLYEQVLKPSKLGEKSNFTESEYKIIKGLYEELKNNIYSTHTDKEARAAIERLESYYMGVLFHEIAHIVTDDALHTATLSAYAKTDMGRSIANKMQKDEEKGKIIDINYSLDEEFVEIEKKKLAKNVIQNTGINKFSKEDEQLFNVYSDLAINTLPMGLSNSLSTLHNIIIDIYIENSITTVVPPDEIENNIRTECKLGVDAVRALLTPTDKFNRIASTILTTSLLSGTDKVSSFLFNIIGPYIDPRNTIPKGFDIKKIIEVCGFSDMLEQPANVENIFYGETKLFHQPDIKNPTYMDVINELRLINSKNQEYSQKMMSSDIPPLSYEFRLNNGLSAGYFTQLFRQMVLMVKDECLKISELEQKYNEYLLKVKELLKEASGLEKNSDIKNDIDFVEKMLPNKSSMSATQIIEYLDKTKAKGMNKKAQDKVNQAIDILNQLKYRAVNQNNPSASQAFDNMLPPDETEDNIQNNMNQNNQESQEQGQESQNQESQNQASPNQDGNQEKSSQEQQGQKQESGSPSSDSSQNQPRAMNGDNQKESDNSPSDEQRGANENSPSAESDSQSASQANNSDSKEKKSKENGHEKGENEGGLGEELYNAKKRMQSEQSSKEDLEKEIENFKNRNHESPDLSSLTENMNDEGEFDSLKDKIQEKKDEILENINENPDMRNIDQKSLDELLNRGNSDKEHWDPLKDNTKDENFMEEIERNGGSFSGDALSAYEVVKSIIGKKLDDTVEEIYKNMTPTDGRVIPFYKRGTEKIAKTAVKTKHTGKINTNKKIENQFFALNINWVLDTSGSMDGYFNFEANGKKYNMSYINFAKGLIKAVSEKLAIYGVTINLWTFGWNDTAEKTFGRTFCINPKNDNAMAEAESQMKIFQLEKTLDYLEAHGGTCQAGATTEALRACVDEYIKFKREPNSVDDEDKKRLFKDIQGDVPSNVFFLITDDYTVDYKPIYEKILHNYLNKGYSHNFQAARMGNNLTDSPKTLFKGFPVTYNTDEEADSSKKFDSTKMATSVIGNYNYNGVEQTSYQGIHHFVSEVCHSLACTVERHFKDFSMEKIEDEKRISTKSGNIKGIDR